MNKRILSILLCLTLVASLLVLAIPVNAASAKEVTVTADKTTAKPGDTVTFTLTIGAVEGMGNVSTKTVIPEGLTYVDGSLTDDKTTVNRVMDFFEFDGKPTMDFSNGKIIFTGYRADDVTTTEECEILSFSCTVDDDATGTITVGIDEFKMGSAEQDKSIADQYTVVPATVTIEGETTAPETTAPETTATETTAPETTAPETTATEEPATEAHIHNIIEIPEVAATTEADGVKGHYECTECGKLFWDGTGTVEITDPTELVIPKLEPSSEETTASESATDATTADETTSDETVAPTKPVATPDSTPDSTKDTSSPQTGDSTHMYLWTLIMLASLAGACAVVIVAKRKGIFTK
ncbi:MAG: LPXTG cell wall anchor domain-containing protein [Ruminococcus sp.]|nr:LPXTG cell wall anchor domain-containing protein [Ruminococcus sp.]